MEQRSRFNAQALFADRVLFDPTKPSLILHETGVQGWLVFVAAVSKAAYGG
jgi:hypothetical protein